MNTASLALLIAALILAQVGAALILGLYRRQLDPRTPHSNSRKGGARPQPTQGFDRSRVAPQTGTNVYLCGPPAMLEALVPLRILWSGVPGSTARVDNRGRPAGDLTLTL